MGNWPQNKANPLKSENFTSPKHRHVGCLLYPDAIAWNVGTVHLDFNLCERIWRSGPQRANLKVHFDIYPFGATSSDTLTKIKIWLDSANIPGHCLWIDTPQSTCLCSGDIKFSLFDGWAPFRGQFPTSKNFLNQFLATYPMNIQKNGS